jgi:hypothetical protein
MSAPFDLAACSMMQPSRFCGNAGQDQLCCEALICKEQFLSILGIAVRHDE